MIDYRLSRDAEIDLARIWRFIGRDNPAAADRFIASLIKTMETLQTQPRMGRSREDFGPGARSLPHPPYLIVYRVHEETVNVSRIIHGSRDVQRALASGPGEPPES